MGTQGTRHQVTTCRLLLAGPEQPQDPAVGNPAGHLHLDVRQDGKGDREQNGKEHWKASSETGLCRSLGSLGLDSLLLSHNSQIFGTWIMWRIQGWLKVGEQTE